jgi:hypothetical protein
MTFSFTRTNCDGTYFRDIDLSLPYAVKYDLYNDGVLVGTLITNMKQSFCQFRDEKAYRRHTKSWGNPAYEHLVLDEAGNGFTRLTIEAPMFKGEEVTLVFFGHHYTYKLNKKSFRKEKGLDLLVECKQDEEVVFRLKNNAKRKFGTNNQSRPMEGIVELSDQLPKVWIFGFLLAIQLYFYTDEWD